MDIRYIVKNKHTGSIYKKYYHISEVECKGLGKLFDIENYIVLSRDLFTSLKDKNGNRIYDGDLLDFDEKEWGGEFEPETITIEKLINDEVSGVLSDIKEWRKIVGHVHEEAKCQSQT